MTSLPGFMLERPGLNGGRASDWLRPSPQWEVSSQTNFIPNHLPRLANNTRLEPYSSIDCIPSTTGGDVGCRLLVVDRKAGGLADARHIE